MAKKTNTSEPKNFLRNRNLTIDLAGPDAVIVCLKVTDRAHQVMAGKVNRLVKRFPIKYVFQVGEELSFTIKIVQLHQISAIMRIEKLEGEIMDKFESGKLGTEWQLSFQNESLRLH